MSDTTEYFSGPWTAGDGSISDVDNYQGNAVTGFLGATTSFGYDEGVAGAYLDDGFPNGGNGPGGEATLVTFVDDEIEFLAGIEAPPDPPEGEIGAKSMLGFGPLPPPEDQPTIFDWTTEPSDAPSPPSEAGIFVDLVDDEDTVPSPPEYTVSGDASVASIAVYSNDGVGGTITFTGAITVALLTVDAVTANVKGGSVTLSAVNAPTDDDGNLENWVTVDGEATLEFSGGATAMLVAAQDALQVANGTVLVTGSGTSLTTQGLELGEINVGDDPAPGGSADLMVRAGASVTIDAQGAFHLYIGDAAQAIGEIDASGSGSSVQINGTIVIGDDGDALLRIGQGATGEIMGDVMLAAHEGSSGTITLTGMGASLSISGTLTIGGAGMAEVTVGNGATLDPPDIILAAMAGGNTQALTINGGTVLVGMLTVGEAGTASVVMTAGSLDVADDTTIGHLTGAAGTVTLTGDSTWSAQSLTIGDAGMGTLSISGGASAMATDTTIGAQEGSQGQVDIGNDGSWEVDLTVGDAGSGTLTVGGMVTVDDELVVGAQSTGIGTVEIAGDGQLSLSGGDITIGQAGTGYVSVSGGGQLMVDGGSITVGESGTGVLLFQQGGGLAGNDDLKQPDVVLGEANGSSGTMIVTDGGTSVQIGSIVVGENGSGNLTVTAGALLQDSGDADIADSASAQIQGATVSQGGVWKIGGALTVGTDGLGTLSILSSGQVFGANDVTVGDGAGASGILVVSGTVTTGSGVQKSSLGYGTSLTIGNFGVGSLEISAGAIVAADQGGEGLIEVGATLGGAGVVTVSSAELSGTTLEIGSAGASARVEIGGGGLVSINGNATLAATGQVALSGGTLSSDIALIAAGGQLTGYGLVAGIVTDNGLIVASGGLLDLSSVLLGNGSADVAAGATLELGSSDLLRRIQLSGSNAVLKLATPGTLGGIAGFAASDSIDLTGIAGGVAATMSGSTLDVTNSGGTVIAMLDLIGSYADASFAVGGDGAAGSVITLAASQPEGGPAVAPPNVIVSVPQSVQAAGGAATALSGLSVSDANAGSTVTATLSTWTGMLSGGGSGAQSLDGGTVLVLTGSLAEVNTALGGITYTGEAGGSDTAVLSVTDSAGDGGSQSFTVSVPDQAPTLALPQAQTVTAEKPAAVPGIAIASQLAGNAVFTVTLSDATGTLAATAKGASAISGAGSEALSVTGDLADVNADLATLTYLGASTGAAASVADSIAVAVDDGSGGTASGAVALTVDRAPDVAASITLPGTLSLVAGAANAINGVSISDADTAGKMFTTTLSVADGTLVAPASGADIVAGDGTGTIEISGVLSDVNASLAGLVDNTTSPGSGIAETDTLHVNIADNIGASGSAHAALVIADANSFVWTGLSGGAFSDAGTWQPAGGPPVAGDVAQFGAGSYQVTGDGTAGEIEISGSASFTGAIAADGITSGQPALVIDGGGGADFTSGASLTTQSTAIIGATGAGVLEFGAGSSASLDTAVESGAASSVVLGVAAAGTGIITIAGPATQIESQSDWIIGDSGLGSVQITGGAVVTAGTGDASGDFSTSVLGNLAGSQGALDLGGAGSEFDDSGALIVGDLGQGEMVIDDGAEVISDAPAGDASAVLGYQAGGSGSVRIQNPGAVWDSQQNAEIGYDGTGHVYVFNGGTFEVDGTALRIGRDTGSNGMLFVSGPGSALIAPAAVLDVGDAGTGTASLSAGANAAVAAVLVSAAAGGSGTLDLSDATLTVSGGITVNDGQVSIDAASTVTAASLAINTGGTFDDEGTLSVSGTITLNGGTLIGTAQSALATPVLVTGGSVSSPSALRGQISLATAVSLDPGVALKIDPDAILPDGVTGFALGDTLEFDQTELTAPVAAASWSDNSLNLFDDEGNSLYSLVLPGDFANDGFSVTQLGTIAAISAFVPGNAPPSFDWFGGTGTFNTAADWSNNGASGVPGTADTASFLQGGTLQGSGTVETVAVSSQALFDANLTAVGATIDSGGTLALGSGAAVTMSGLLTVGGTGVGALDVNAGATATATAFIDIGENGLGSGLIDVTGQSALLSDTGAVEIGESGSGALDVGTGGSVSAAFAELGHDLGSDGSADIASGGTFSDGSTIIGDLGRGTLEIDAGGSLLQTSFATIGNTSYASLAAVSVAGLWNIAASLDVGYAIGGTLDITAGGTVDVGSFFRLGGAAQGVGTVTESGTGAVLSVGGGAFIGENSDDASGQGSYGTGSWTIENGATATAASLDLINGAVLVTAASLTITGTVSGAGSLTVTGGALDVGGAVAQSTTITLDPSIFTIGDVAGFAGAVVMSAGDVIDVTGADGGSYVSDGGTFATGAFIITEGGMTIGTIDAVGYSARDFTFASGPGGLVINDVQTACYGAGTMIATPAGETAIEDLRPGDLVLTLENGARPVVWIGHQTMRCADDPAGLWPIRVRSGACGDGLPLRDLVLSPEHAVFASECGVLIPIHALVNGHSITQERCDQVEYWHLALGGHDVVLAEGLPAESFLAGGPGLFGSISGLPEMAPCAPRRTQGPDVAAMRARLAAGVLMHS